MDLHGDSKRWNENHLVGLESALTDALCVVGLGDKTKRLPGQLSGGEQQRVAIARAIVTRPGLIVADEPTGSLDQASGHVVFDLLAGLATTGTTVVLITHDRHLASESDRVIEMLDGAIDHNPPPGSSAVPLIVPSIAGAALPTAQPIGAR